MFKFKLGRKQSDETEIQSRSPKTPFKLQKLFDRGFPSRPSAIAYDPHLQLIAIGTQLGEIRIYGQPEFQLSSSLDRSSTIRQMIFVTGQARLVLLTTDGYLHFFQINNGPRLRLHSLFTSNEDQQTILMKMQTCCLLRDQCSLIIGLTDGNIYRFDLEQFTLQPWIAIDHIGKILPEHPIPSSVQSIVQHPIHDERILIAYKNKLIVQWNSSTNSHDRSYLCTEEIESVCWYNQGKHFASSHSNGSYALWDTVRKSVAPLQEKIPYGPYPCTPMKKIVAKSQRNGDPLIMFTGGLPRSSYANKHSVSCLDEKEYAVDRTRHVAFDFTSAVVDFFTIDQDPLREDPHSLVVLLNEEIIVIDLLTDHWPLYRLPYLTSIHASPVICTTVVCHIQEEFYQSLCRYGSLQFEEYSDRPWPIMGGEKVSSDTAHTERNLLLTGHEDGSVKFWDVTSPSMPLLYQLKTTDYFQIEQAPEEDPDEESWPPFRKTGLFDPYCDDPRLAIQKLALCTNTGILIVAGTAGQILTFQLTDTPADIQIDGITVNLLEGHENFVWKGHEELKTRSTRVPAGLAATSLIQLYPPAAVSALAFYTDLQLYSVGTAHGFALINYQQKRLLLAQCTLDPHAIVSSPAGPLSTGHATLNRGRSLKKSLRESFRRLRKGRTIKKATMIDRIDEDQPFNPTDRHTAEIIRVPVERQVEFRDLKPVQDHVLSMVRCLYFARTYLNSVHDRTHSLWIGTNGGHIYVYSITNTQMQSNDEMNAIGSDPSMRCALAKEIRLKHKAPVLSIMVLDGSNRMIGQGSNIPSIDIRTSAPLSPISTHSDHAASASALSHKVLICSEEQFKIFTLPNLKPFGKFKLTATEGSRVRKVTIYQPSNSTNETSLICLDNMGELSVYSLPLLRRQNLFHCIKPSDINAISSLQFSYYPHVFYLQSSSELTELTYSSDTEQLFPMVLIPERAMEKTVPTSVENESIKAETVLPPSDNSEEPIKESLSVDMNENDATDPTNPSPSIKIEDDLHEKIYADSAVDVDSIETSIHETSSTNDKIQIVVDDSESSPQVQEDIDRSPTRRKKGPAPPPPPASPKSNKLKSVKTRPAPILNEKAYSNGNEE